jgi:hypothetical protein
MITDSHPSIASKLLRAVIAKSFIEIIFVCAVATLAAFSNFSPLLRGVIDVADQTRVAGWVHDPFSPQEAIEVQLFIDGKFVAARRADEKRDDLVEARATTNPHHGFTFTLDPANLTNGTHTVQVYALRESSVGNKALILISKTSRTIQVDGRR